MQGRGKVNRWMGGRRSARERAKVVGGEKKRTLVLYLSVKSVLPAAKRDIRSWQRRYTERIEDWIYIYRIQGGIATSETMGRHKFIIFSETNLIRRLYLISKKKNGEIYSGWSIDKLLFLARNLKLIFHKYILNITEIKNRNFVKKILIFRRNYILYKLCTSNNLY